MEVIPQLLNNKVKHYSRNIFYPLLKILFSIIIEDKDLQIFVLYFRKSLPQLLFFLFRQEIIFVPFWP